jgi:hypothetical protein
MSFLKTFTPYFPICLLITIVVAIVLRQLPTDPQFTGGESILTGLAAAAIYAGGSAWRKP